MANITMPDNPAALKHFINEDAVSRLGTRVNAVHSTFDLKGFKRTASCGLQQLEFTARTRHVAEALAAYLPTKPSTALDILVKSLPDVLPGGDGMFSEHFWVWPVSDFIRDFGAKDWAASMDACYALTRCFTAEFAIRPLLVAEPDKGMAQLLSWSSDPCEHVRRLCSEGARPRLPWASRLDLPRDAVMLVLENLRSDPSQYVQKSVANHLNDLGKEAPDWLVETMTRWSNTGDKNTAWVIRHALRTQIKSGHPGALALLGYTPPQLEHVTLNLNTIRVAVGDSITANLLATNSTDRPQALLIDWRLFYARRERGKSLKVFKGKQLELAAGEQLTLKKSFSLVERATRALHPGSHRLEVQINGQVAAGVDFELTST